MKVNAGSDNSLDLITTMVTFPRAVQTFPLNRNHFLYHHSLARFSQPISVYIFFSFAIIIIIIKNSSISLQTLTLFRNCCWNYNFLYTDKNEFWHVLTTTVRARARTTTSLSPTLYVTTKELGAQILLQHLQAQTSRWLWSTRCVLGDRINLFFNKPCFISVMFALWRC